MNKLNIIIFMVLLAFSANALKYHSGLRNKKSDIPTNAPVTVIPPGFTINGNCLVPNFKGNWICSDVKKTNCCAEWSSLQCVGAIDQTTGACPFKQLAIICSLNKDLTKGLQCESG